MIGQSLLDAGVRFPLGHRVHVVLDKIYQALEAAFLVRNDAAMTRMMGSRTLMAGDRPLWAGPLHRLLDPHSTEPLEVCQ